MANPTPNKPQPVTVPVPENSELVLDAAPVPFTPPVAAAPEVPKTEEPPATPVEQTEVAVAPLIPMTPQQIADMVNQAVKTANKVDMDTSSIVPLLKDDEGNPAIPISLDAHVTKQHFNPHHGPKDRICV